MWNIIIQIALVPLLFMVVRYCAYKWTEKEHNWLNYKPFNCETCLTFWSLIFTYLAIYLVFNFKFTLALGVIITVLNAVSMWIDQKQKTVKLSDFKED